MKPVGNNKYDRVVYRYKNQFNNDKLIQINF